MSWDEVKRLRLARPELDDATESERKEKGSLNKRAFPPSILYLARLDSDVVFWYPVLYRTGKDPTRLWTMGLARSVHVSRPAFH